MPQSLVKNYVHLVFSTKYRHPIIDKEIQPILHAYMGGICNELKCYPRAIGGIEDHVHLLCMLDKNIALAALLNKIKSNSSKWIKTQGEKNEYQHFSWQRGYGAFSVNPSEIEVVMQYIRHQEEHHKKRTFKQEFRLFLKKYEMEYDEHYVWD